MENQCVFCTACHWLGESLELKFIDGWDCCPCCESNDSLLSGEQAEEVKQQMEITGHAM